jgi:hypothetical protein
MERVCLDCGEHISGRVDKKFCSDLCRNNYNNHIDPDRYDYMRSVNQILRKNRRILEEILPTEGKVSMDREKLILHGFNFEFFTHLQKTQEGTAQRCIYEFSYIPLENDMVQLIRRATET